MPGNQIGAVIDSGLMDWQIVQQDEQGYGTIMLRGRWFPDAMLPGTGNVHVRIVSEATGAAVSQALEWAAADTRDDGTWAAELRVPAGGCKLRLSNGAWQLLVILGSSRSVVWR